MKYTSQLGSSKPYKQPPTLVKRSISFVLDDPGTWAEGKVLDIVWKNAGYLCTEVKLRDIYRTEGKVCHGYDLFFQTGRGLIHPEKINELVTRIEADLKAIGLELRGTHAIES